MKPRVYNPTLNSSISSKGRNRQWKTFSWIPLPPRRVIFHNSACSTCFCAQMCVDCRLQLYAFLAAPFWFLDPKVPENSWYIRMDSQKWQWNDKSQWKLPFIKLIKRQTTLPSCLGPWFGNLQSLVQILHPTFFGFVLKNSRDQLLNRVV